MSGKSSYAFDVTGTVKATIFRGDVSQITDPPAGGSGTG